MDRRREYGDYQTPPDFGRRVCLLVKREGYAVGCAAALDPTCGVGGLLAAAQRHLGFSEEALHGVEVDEGHLAAARRLLPGARLVRGDVFEVDLGAVCSDRPVLVLGNPPWATNSDLSRNRPPKSNFRGLRGLEALTGASNFDICESVVWRALEAFAGTASSVCVLCKTNVARALLLRLHERGVAVSRVEAFPFDAGKVFGVSASACLFCVRLAGDLSAEPPGDPIVRGGTPDDASGGPFCPVRDFDTGAPVDVLAVVRGRVRSLGPDGVRVSPVRFPSAAPVRGGAGAKVDDACGDGGAGGAREDGGAQAVVSSGRGSGGPGGSTGGFQTLFAVVEPGRAAKAGPCVLSSVPDLEGDSPLVWRSGVKHDCAAVVELRKTEEGLVNGLGETVDVEPDLVHPLAKSSSFKRAVLESFDRRVLVTQKRPGEDTRWIRERLPRTWAYLERHADRFAARRSAVWRGAPPYAVFGVGDYSFAPYKVGVSGFYKTPLFALLCADRPVMTDDTCCFLSFADFRPAYAATLLLNTAPVRAFLLSLAFLDGKRPWTAGLLSRLDLNRALATVSFGEMLETERDLGLSATLVPDMVAALARHLAEAGRRGEKEGGSTGRLSPGEESPLSPPSEGRV